MNIESMQEELKRTKDMLARARAQAQLYKKESEEKNHELKAALASLNARLESDSEKIKDLRQKEKDFAASLRVTRQQLKIAQAEAARLRSSLPGFERLLAMADYIHSQPPRIRAILDETGYVTHDLAAFLCRCGNREALFELWQALRQLAMEQDAVSVAEGVLVYILNQYNQATHEKLLAWYPKLEACSTPQASAWWVIPFYEDWWQVPNSVERVLLPGLMNVEGDMFMEPLLKLRY